MNPSAQLAIILVAAILLADLFHCQEEVILLAKLKNKNALGQQIKKAMIQKAKTKIAQKNWRSIIFGAASVVHKAKGTALKKMGTKKMVKGTILGPLGIPKKMVAKVSKAKGGVHKVKGAVLGIKSIRAKFQPAG